MRIVYFTESLPPLVDGVSRTLGKLFDFLEARGVDFRIYSPVEPEKGRSWSRFVRVLPSFPFPLYDYYRVSLPADSLKKELEDFRPDVIHAVSPTPCGIFGLDFARKRNIPSVTSYHTHFVSYFKHYGLSLLEEAGWAYLRWFHNQGAATFAPSRDAMDQLSRRGFSRLEHWGRGVDLERFSPRFREDELRRKFGNGNPILLFVGRLVSEKNLDDLAGVYDRLRKKKMKFKLVLAGDGPLRAYLQRRMPEAHFTGTIKGTELSRWYASADIFVFPSTTETFGNVVQEAMASGLPVVAARQGGPVDLVRDGATGFLAKPNNPRDFARYTVRLIRKETERLAFGAEALEAVREMGWDLVHSILLRNYEKIVCEFKGNLREKNAA